MNGNAGAAVVLHRDSDWLVLDKPCGISTHAADAGDLGLVDWWKLHEAESLHVISRLDRGTSGVLAFALHRRASAEAERIHETGAATKRYVFLTAGNAPAATWRRDEPIDGKAAATAFEALETSGGRTLMRATITHGRRHQVRRHAAASGAAVLGDELYGGAPFPRLALHCEEVQWPGQAARWQSPVPASFRAALTEESSAGIEMLAALERRGRLLDRTGDAWRVVHRGEVGDGNFAIDRYGNWLLVSGFDEELTAPQLRERIAPLLQTTARVLGTGGALLRSYQRDPHRHTLVADTCTWESAPPEHFTVTEHGLAFEIRFDRSRHPGLFLDQRDNRRRLGRDSSGRRVANLFAFTASFSAVAAAGGADLTASVDLASGSLAVGRRNVAAARADRPGRDLFANADVRDWLARQGRKRAREGAAFAAWDRVICDPPVFAAGGKGKRFELAAAWPELARSVAGLMATDGWALFSNNHRGGDGAAYAEALAEAFSSVVALRPPLDFPRPGQQAETMRAWICRKPRQVYSVD